MPRKEQGWITFQTSTAERQILEQICQQTQRTKTEILREMIRQLGQSAAAAPVAAMGLAGNPIEFSDEEKDLSAEDSEDDGIGVASAATLQAVKISARNILKAKVKRIVKGRINAEVTLTIAPDVELVSIVTRASADKLGLRRGKEIFAVIKSSSVMIAAE